MKGADTASPYLVAMPAPVLPTPPKSPLKLPPWSRVDGGAWRAQEDSASMETTKRGLKLTSEVSGDAPGM